MEQLGTAIILCTRYKSSRLPGKPLRLVNGIPLVQHLINRLNQSKVPVILAYPEVEKNHFQELDGCYKFYGSENDPMARMLAAAKAYGVETIIRVTHDKVFVDAVLLKSAIAEFRKKKADYLFSSLFTEGTGFEIFKTSVLEHACKRFKDVEFISYAIKAVADSVVEFNVPVEFRSKARLLIDYPEDLLLIQLIFKALGNNAGLGNVLRFVADNLWVHKINELPLVTIYSCAYNAEAYVSEAILSIVKQNIFNAAEVILIDDCSTDKTLAKLLQWKAMNSKFKVISNPKNLGLAASSNIALSESRGRYVIRLDADDYFTDVKAIEKMIDRIRLDKSDAVYPSNYFGAKDVLQHGSVSHHIGGSLFCSKALNHLKFTERLRHFEGLDFFVRASKQLKISYLEEALFFYRQHEASLSKNNLKERQTIKAEILKNVDL